MTRGPAGFQGAAVTVVDPDAAAALVSGAGPERVQEGSAPARHAGRAR